MMNGWNHKEPWWIIVLKTVWVSALSAVTAIITLRLIGR